MIFKNKNTIRWHKRQFVDCEEKGVPAEALAFYGNQINKAEKMGVLAFDRNKFLHNEEYIDIDVIQSYVSGEILYAGKAISDKFHLNSTVQLGSRMYTIKSKSEVYNVSRKKRIIKVEIK